MTYQQFFNHLDTRFGSMPTSTARAVWTDVRFELEGKITPAKFNAFKDAFLSAMLDVKDTTSDEATRILLSKLQRYQGIMSWTNRAESKEGESHPAFEISFGMPPCHVKDFFRSSMPKLVVLPHALWNVVLRVFGWCHCLTGVQRKERLPHYTIVVWRRGE